MEATAETTEKPNLLQDAMKNGLILGAVHIVLFLALYYLAPELLGGFTYLLIVMVLNFGFIIYTGIQFRAELGGYMSFGTAFKHAFLVFAFNGLLNAVFFILFLFVEPSLPQVMADAQLETSLYWAEKMGAPEATIDKMREDFDAEEIKERFGFSGQLVGLGFAAIFYAIGSTIIALITRKNVPLDM